MRFLRWTAIILTGLACLYLAICTTLVFWPYPEPFAGERFSLEEMRAAETAAGADFGMDVPFREDTFATRDGETLFARRYGPEDGSAILFLHGVAADSSILNRFAGQLQVATGAEVITPDLRGHGRSSGDRFNLDHTGQYEEDVEDMLAALGATRPGRPVVLGGHSMGGGISLRYALRKEAPAVDGYLLIAPNFGDPVRHPPPEPSSEEAREGSRYVQMNGKRLMGQIFLGLVGIHVFERLPVINFNKPPEFPAYSFAAIASAQPNPPEDAAVALEAIKVPLLVVVGANDEVFDAGRYEPLVSTHSKGETHVFAGLTHQGVLNSPAVHDRIGVWYATLGE
ncbi:MAG: alpha/beta fold hydrolase [Opitutaceae bacterium]